MPDGNGIIDFYLAGKMSGLPDLGHAKFSGAASVLRELGYTVENPAEHDGGSTDKTREFYMGLDVMAIMKCKAIMLVDGGLVHSRGAFAEIVLARELNKSVFVYTYVGPNTQLDVEITKEVDEWLDVCRPGCIVAGKVMINAQRTQKHQPYTWAKESQWEHWLKCARHAISAFMSAFGLTHTMDEHYNDHLNFVVCRALMGAAVRERSR